MAKEVLTCPTNWRSGGRDVLTLGEAQLAHREKNEVRAAYNRALYLNERALMMQQWADYLDAARKEK